MMCLTKVKWIQCFIPVFFALLGHPGMGPMGPRMPHGRMPGPMNPVCSLLKNKWIKLWW